MRPYSTSPLSQGWIDWSKWSYNEILFFEQRRRLEIYASALASDELKRYHLERARRDFFYWRANFCWTFDDDRGTVPYVPLAGHDELQSYILGLKGYRNSVGDPFNTLLYASRKRGKTLSYVAPAVWRCFVETSTKHWTITAQQQSSVDNNTFVFSSAILPKIRWMIHRMPGWMRPEAWKATWLEHRKIHREGAAQANRFLLLQNLQTGSSIRGATANVNRERGGRAERCVVDEANIVTNLRALLASFSKVGPWSLVSSVEGRHTTFAQYAHGEIMKLSKDGSDGLVVRGWHYSEHPLYNPETPEGAARIKAERANFPSKEAWASEMENDWQESVPGRIWGPDFDVEDDEEEGRFSNICTPDETGEVLAKGHLLELYEGWDFGVSSSLTAVVWGYYDDSADVLYLAGLRQWRDALASEVARDVCNMGYTSSHGGATMPDYRVGDIAGKIRGRRTSMGRLVSDRSSWIRNLREVGIEVRGQSLKVEEAISLVRQKLREGKIKLMPLCLSRHPEEPDYFPSLEEVFRGYRRDLKGQEPSEYVGDSPKPKKDIFSHAADAVQHIAWAIWR